MKFKARDSRSQMPEVNLVPMMDVIMTILTFFIIVSMTMTNFQAIDVALPSSQSGVSDTTPVDPLIVGLDRQGQILLEGQPSDQARLAQQVTRYLQQNPKGTVVLKADQAIPYQQVVKILGVLREMGGDRVSLAIE
jgi:biopolymer transport protein ExbD